MVSSSIAGTAPCFNSYYARCILPLIAYWADNGQQADREEILAKPLYKNILGDVLCFVASKTMKATEENSLSLIHVELRLCKGAPARSDS